MTLHPVRQPHRNAHQRPITLRTGRAEIAPMVLPKRRTSYLGKRCGAIDDSLRISKSDCLDNDGRNSAADSWCILYAVSGNASFETGSEPFRTRSIPAGT